MSLADAMALASKVKGLRDSLPGLKADVVEAQRVSGDAGERVALLAARDVKEGQVGERDANHAQVLGATKPVHLACRCMVAVQLPVGMHA